MRSSYSNREPDSGLVRVSGPYGFTWIRVSVACSEFLAPTVSPGLGFQWLAVSAAL